MIINFIREQILNPLQTIIGIVDKKQTMQILTNVHAKFNESGILLIATDLELEIHAQALIPDFKMTEELSEIIFSGYKLLDILKSLPDQSTVKLQIKDNHMVILSRNSRFKIQTITGEAFPKIEQQPEIGQTIFIEQKILKKIINRTQYAMPIKDIRYYLNGALLKTEDCTVIMAATDGHRLAVAQENFLDDNNTHAEVTLPRKAILELEKLLKDTDNNVKITIKSKQILFDFDSIQLLSKLIDNNFPQYERVIPNQLNIGVPLNRLLMLEVLTRVAILSTDKVQGVRMLLSNQKIAVLCANSNNEEANEEMAVAYDGEPIELGFNVHYLMDIMSNLTEQTILMKIGDSTKSVIFTLPENEEAFKYVVMPMRI